MYVGFSLLRGGSKFDSLLDIERCGFVYHLCNISLAVGAFLFVKALIAGLVVAE